MNHNKTPSTYFVPRNRSKAIRLADSRDIVDSMLEGNYEEVKGLVANSILYRLEQKEVLQRARRQGGVDMQNQLFN